MGWNAGVKGAEGSHSAIKRQDFSCLPGGLSLKDTMCQHKIMPRELVDSSHDDWGYSCFKIISTLQHIITLSRLTSLFENISISP